MKTPRKPFKWTGKAWYRECGWVMDEWMHLWKKRYKGNSGRWIPVEVTIREVGKMGKK